MTEQETTIACLRKRVYGLRVSLAGVIHQADLPESDGSNAKIAAIRDAAVQGQEYDRELVLSADWEILSKRKDGSDEQNSTR